MAKIRLNRDRRDILLGKAREIVEATPIDPKIEKRHKVAIVGYDKAHAALAKAAKADYGKLYTAADIKTLRKFDLSQLSNTPYFVDLDTRNNFQVALFNSIKWNRDNLPKGVTGEHQIMSWEKRQELRSKQEKAKDKTNVVMSKSHRVIEASKATIKAYGAFRTANDELDMAAGADKERRSTVLKDFAALIESVNTFEAVCEVWPEAKECTPQIVDTTRALSVMSSEAIERIQKNMADRGVTAD